MPESIGRLDLAASLPVALLCGAALAITARLDATALLVAIAAVQALLASAWVFGTATGDRLGIGLPGLLAAAGADVCVTRWPHGQLGTLLIVFALCVPVLYLAQLLRGAARTRVTDSLGSTALLVLAETALPALLQLRHEYARTDGPEVGGQVVFGVMVVLAGALVVGYLVDLLVTAPRFDPAVPRGLLAVVASTGLGGSLGYLVLQAPGLTMLQGGRGAALGAALGAIVALAAVGAAFVEHDAALCARGDRPVAQWAASAAGHAAQSEQGGPPAGGAASGTARRWGAAVSALLPLAVLAPVAFVLALALRT